MTDQAEYDQDFFLWSRAQADALRVAARSGANLPVDWENVAEEIESLGRSDRRELASRLRVIMEHLLKLRSSAATEPRGGWIDTVLRERSDVAGLLQQSPSLHREVPALIDGERRAARRIVANARARFGEALADEPELTEEQVLGDWLP
ncbi:MAG TPA: DUF29 domain-containing protein [Acetobacteraceae bacterium]